MFPKVPDPQEFVMEALERDVITVPGASCGIYGEDHVRLSYATSYEEIELAMDRLDEVYL